MSPRPLLLALALLAPPAAASDFTPEEVKAAHDDPRAFTIADRSVALERLGAGFILMPEPARQESGLESIVLIERVVNLGLQAWKIIDENRPVVDVSQHYASALPEGVSGWSALSGWRTPGGPIYGITAKNAYGMTLVDIRYQVARSYGGSYKGKGKYLTAVTIVPLKAEVAWGVRVSVEATVPDSGVVNAGTDEEPVAGMTAQLAWRIRTPLKDSQGKGVYYVQGDGLSRELGGPFLGPEEWQGPPEL